MKELVSVAILIASLCGGSIVGIRILRSAREVTLTKASRGLPRLSPLSHSLTRQTRRKEADPRRELKEQVNKSSGGNINESAD